MPLLSDHDGNKLGAVGISNKNERVTDPLIWELRDEVIYSGCVVVHLISGYRVQSRSQLLLLVFPSYRLECAPWGSCGQSSGSIRVSITVPRVHGNILLPESST